MLADRTVLKLSQHFTWILWNRYARNSSKISTTRWFVSDSGKRWLVQVYFIFTWNLPLYTIEQRQIIRFSLSYMLYAVCYMLTLAVLGIMSSDSNLILRGIWLFLFWSFPSCHVSLNLTLHVLLHLLEWLVKPVDPASRLCLNIITVDYP